VASLVAGDLHGDGFRYASSREIANRAASQIVNQCSLESAFLACRRPGFFEVPDSVSVMMENGGTIQPSCFGAVTRAAVHRAIKQGRLEAVRGEIVRLIRKKPTVIVLSKTVTASATDMIRAVSELGLEGIMAKRLDSLYEYGKRSGAWVKFKINKGQEFVVGGYTPGNPFDAVIVGYYRGNKLVYAGKVHAGFVPHVRREVMARMSPLETDVCPFGNLPEKKRRTQWVLTAEEMKNCVWLKPE
jgi:hypothetical protein